MTAESGASVNTEATTKRAILSVGILAGLLFAGRAQATLYDRGNGLIYDDVLNITWLQDVNLAGGVRTSWNDAMAWADGLIYQGWDDWRLPTSPATQQGYINEGEMGNLYYTTLGNPVGGPRINDGPFENFSTTTGVFWLSAMPLHPGSAWMFDFRDGFQNAGSENQPLWMWAVRDGDVAANDDQGQDGDDQGQDDNDQGRVPEPSTLILLGVGIVGLAAWGRRKTA